MTTPSTGNNTDRTTGNTTDRTTGNTTDRTTGNTTDRNMAVIITAGSIVISVTLGVRATMGLYLGPIEDTLGISTATFGFTIALQNLVWGLGQPLAGALADRFGSVRVLLAGIGLYALGLLVMADASTGPGLHLSGGVLTGLGMAAASFAVILSSIARLVEPKHQSKALGIVTAGGSVGHFLIVPAAGLLLDSYGWRTCLVVLAALLTSVALVTRPLRSSDTQTKSTYASNTQTKSTYASNTHTKSTHTESTTAVVVPETLRGVLRIAARHRSYLMLNAAFFSCGFHVTFVALHLPKALEDMGQSSQTGTLALTLLGLFNIAGAFIAGWLGTKHDKSLLLSGIYTARALTIGSFLLLPVNQLTTAGFAIALGLFWLATVPLTSGIVLSQFGPTHSGTLFGVVFWSHQIGAFVGAYGGGLVRDATGSYTLCWLLAIFLALGAAVLHLRISDAAVDLRINNAAGGLRKLAKADK